MKNFLLLLVVLGSSPIFPQTVFEPAASSIYDYLNRLSIKGLITLNDEIKPLSRAELADMLMVLENKKNTLTSLELEELKFYKQEFAAELEIICADETKENLQFFRIDEQTGFRFLFYQGENFTFNLDPIFGYAVKNKFDELQKHRWNGLQFYGYYNDWGFDFYFRDNAVYGEKIDRTRWFTTEPGFNLSQNNLKSIEFADVQGLLSYSWKNGSISIGKEHIEWGSGIGGKLILSDKAPSFPFIKLEFSPVSWLKFVYFHGWLYSNLIDSSSIRTTLVGDRNSYSQREKFIAAHMISIYPTENLSISLGESMIYSDKLEFAYFVPVLFFRVVDHYISRDSVNSGDNAQLFFNAVYKNYDIRTKFYTTIFIDELSITNILKGTNLSAIGFTAGLSLADPIIENSELSIEYTRLNPFVYMNSNDAQLFTSHGYQLGHWIGSNGDQIYAEYKQSILRGLKIKLWGEHIRKGQRELPEQQYLLPYPEFLYGDRLSLTNAGVVISYEILHNLQGRAEYSYSNLSDESAVRSPNYMLGKQSTFGLSFGYGF